MGAGVQGLYVRVNIGNSSGGERRYLVCEVLGIRDKASECQVGAPRPPCVPGAPRPPCVPGAVGGGVPRVRALVARADLRGTGRR